MLGLGRNQGELTLIKPWSLETNLSVPPDSNGSRSEQERKMKKAVNDGIRKINMSRMNAVLLRKPEHNPFLYEQ